MKTTGLKLIYTICARGGSKGVANKNLRMIFDKPLIAHTIIQAKNSKLFGAIAVSSDSSEILQTAKKFGADVLIERPPELATDNAAKIPVIRHCVLETEKQLNEKFDVVVDLDCTSPLRLPVDIESAINILYEKKCQNVITGSKARRSPYFNLVERNESGRVDVVKKPEHELVRRQDAPKCFDMNASIYVWRREALLAFDNLFLEDTRLYEMPEERSHDIDTELDFGIVEYIAQKRGYLS